LARAVHTVLALEKGDAMTLRESMKDEIAEPIRKHHLPFFDAFQKVVHARNAIACGISGSGPSLFVLMESHQQSQQMDVFLKAWFLEKQGLKVLSFQASLNNGGARVIEVSP
jgi:homoserine kinase